MPAYDEIGFTPPAPVTGVLIRHPDTMKTALEIPMLIDTGADATLLPRSAVNTLGIAGTGERYQLVAFDGTFSESESVRADLMLLKKRFRGCYLLIDSETGVIGRDILNHLKLLLDGPGRSWQELA